MSQVLTTNSVHSFLTSPSWCPTVCFCCSASINEHLRHYCCCSSSIMSCDIIIGPFPAFMFVYGLMWFTAFTNSVLVALPNYMYIFRMAVQISLVYSFSNTWTPSAMPCFVVLFLVLQHPAIISSPAFSSRLEFVANYHTRPYHIVAGHAHCNLQALRARGVSPSLSSIWP